MMAIPQPTRRLVATALLPLLLSACAGFAPKRLYDDQIGYSGSLSDSQKAQTLLNAVRIRYGDSPVFLNTTQVISGYSLQRSLSGTLSILPGNNPANTIAGSPGMTMTQSPTFTFQPVTGAALAQSVIQPLSPAELLPLSLSGTPIDVLFRLAVQSVNGLQNSSMLDTANRTGSPGFAHLLVNLRRLQIAGLLHFRLGRTESGGDPTKVEDGAKSAKAPANLIISLPDSDDPELQQVVVTTRKMLGLSATRTEAEVVYGSGSPSPGTVSILTRPILGVLGQIASEIEVSPQDVAEHRTIPTVDDTAILSRPTIIIHNGEKPPRDAFSSVRYHGRWYWIADTDFDSKLAFSVMQTLVSLAETTQPSGTVVTIPAR